MRRLLLMAVTVVALVGCSTGADPAATVTPIPTIASTPAAAAPVAAPLAPTHISYSAVGVDANLEPTGLNSDGTIAVPPLDSPLDVDYLAWSADLAPGRPTVLVSHVSGRSSGGAAIPGGFFRLHEATAGDLVDLSASDGTVTTYRVTDVTTVPKANFPTSIYDRRAEPTLVLITCGGTLNRAEHSFDSNVLVTAVAT